MAKQLKITYVKSMIGRKPDQRKTMQALGLTKLNKTVLKNDDVAIRGMINKVSHLITVEEV